MTTSENENRVNTLTEGSAMPRNSSQMMKGGLRAALRLVALMAFGLVASASVSPAAALGAPVFGVDIQHQSHAISETPGVITRADRLFDYTIDITNSGTAGFGIGDTVSCTTGNWTNSPTPPHSYRWLRNGVDIPGATSSAYTLQAADESKPIQCVVTATNASGSAQSSSDTLVVNPPPSAAPTPPATLPAITGTVASGNELTCSAGTWGNTPTEYTFQFYRNGVPIGTPTTTPTTSAKHTLTPADVETAAGFQCSVLATNAAGGALKAMSNSKNTSTPPSPLLPTALGGSRPSVKPPVTTVTVAMPEGITTRSNGWNCVQATLLECTSTQGAPAAGVAFPTIKLQIQLDGAIAPSEPKVTVTVATAIGGGASTTAEHTFALEPFPAYGARYFEAHSLDAAGDPFTQAGGHPFLGVSSNGFVNYVTSSGTLVPVEDARTISVELPPGFLGNPLRLPKCEADLVALRKCPAEAQIGTISMAVIGGNPTTVGVFSVKPTGGHPAEFAFTAGGVGEVHLFPSVRSDSDYGITMTSPENTQAKLRYIDFKFWGTPADPIHDAERCFGNGEVGWTGCATGAPSSAPLRALLTNPTNCNPSQVTKFITDSWQHPGEFHEYEFEAPQPTGCEALTENWTSTEEPSISFKPDNGRADTPVGYDVNIHVPQEGLADPDSLASAHLFGSTVTLPDGVAISPSAANGLEACSEAQMGLTSSSPIRFNLNSPNCPDASKIGTMEIQTPVLADPLMGDVYLAAQDANPFGSRYAIYLTIDDKEQGLMLKLAGKVSADPVTGQLKAEFVDNPQLPFTDLRLHFFDGPNAALVNPPTCGKYSTNAALTPWSAVHPANPTAAETATPTSSYDITQGADGGNCAPSKAQVPFAPTLSAGSQSVKAGAESPFFLKVTRADGQQELTSLNVVTPKGLTASLKGVPYCSEASIAAATALSKGTVEQSIPSCPVASQIGTVTTGAGSGSAPFYAKGKAYLSGPYKSAPLSMTIITPAVAGPFDLGNVVVRAGLYVDPISAQITVKSDPIPQMLEGVPLRVRSVAVSMDRARFMRNPSNCTASAVRADAVGSGGAQANLSARFQVGACSALDFAPKMALRLKGGTKRNDHPALTATLTQPEGQANIGSVSVALPHSAFLDQAHIRTVCTRVQFAAKACPAGAIYGSAEAVSPLLDQPLTGPVYLRSSTNKLPDLVVALRGPDSQPIEIELAGRIDSVNGGIRNSFDLVPDAAVSQFVLKMKGGKKGLLVNSRNLCRGPQRATVRMIGQNGKRFDQRPKVTKHCKKTKKAKASPKHRGKR
jgi:hypothetical protein